MNFARALLLALVAALLLAPPALAAKGFEFGVTPGEVTSSSAVLWGKATKSGKYSLEVARNSKFKGKTTQSVAAKKGHDNTLQKRVKGLRPNTKYWFRFVTGSAAAGHARLDRPALERASAATSARSGPRRSRSRTPPSGSPGAAIRTSTPSRARPRRTGTTARCWPHEGGAQQLQRDARRHDLLGQRGAGPPPADRAEREAEVGEVQDQPGEQEPPGAAPLGRLLLALGRPRVRERLLARRELLRQRRERERPHALQPRRAGVPRLRAGELEQAERHLPHRSLGPQPRGLLPRPALVPERERGREPCLRQPADGQPGPGADRAADHAQPVRGRDAVAGAACVRRPASTRFAARTAPTWASGSCSASSRT